MDMGMAPFLALLFLLPSAVSSRDSFMAITNAAERNFQSMGDSWFDVHDHLAKVLDSEVSSSGSSGSDFSSLCMEIARKAKEAITDRNLMCEIDNLASALCTVVPSDFEAKLKTNESCATCHNFLDGIVSLLGDEDKKLLFIVYLFKVCEAQTIVHHCKQYVFTFGPLLLSGLQMIASKDICYMLRICAEPRHLQAGPTDLFNIPPNHKI